VEPLAAVSVIPRTKDELRDRASDSSLVRLRLCGAALLACSALLATGCGGGDTSSGVSGERIDFRQLAQSASMSAATTSGRFAFELSVGLPGADDPFAVSGEGAFDAASDRASFAVDMSSLAKLLGDFLAGLGGPGPAGDLPDLGDSEGWKIEVIHDGKIGYLRFPALDEQLPDGKSWFKVTEGAGSVGGFEFGELEQLSTNDPREVLDSLRAVTSEVETVGTERLRDVDTTHYHAVIDPTELEKRAARGGQEPSQSLLDQLSAQPGLGEVPVDVWIDASGLVRKLSLEFSATGSGTSQTGQASMSFELWDYGEAVEIDLPPTSQVADASALRG
jgi:hypothetical protein